MHWGMLIDLKKCVGCYACTVACQNENKLPLALKYCNVAKVGPVGEYPNLTAYNIPVSCMHCEDASCVHGCPTGASYHREDGIVVVDADKCVGCEYCMVVCPYDVRRMNKETGTVEKCNLCFKRLEQGEVTRCVETCQLQARHVGDLDDPNSEIVKLIRKYNAQPLYPHLGTKPSTYYIMP
ncbi:MAG TPA: 4Fe-4S dicluster domain-containing protein [Negativicutes bacterium]